MTDELKFLKTLASIKLLLLCFLKLSFKGFSLLKQRIVCFQKSWNNVGCFRFPKPSLLDALLSTCTLVSENWNNFSCFKFFESKLLLLIWINAFSERERSFVQFFFGTKNLERWSFVSFERAIFRSLFWENKEATGLVWAS